jgi:predicted MFS family arabinose efflux permease
VSAWRRRGPVGFLLTQFLNDTRGEPIMPLAVLTALYFFDEFDTAAFATLAPDIKRSFHLTDERFVGLVVLNLSMVILLAVPVGYLADRVNRVKLVVASGALAGGFSFVTGLAGSVGILAAARLGNGLGVVANQPIHNSLLTDYYTPAARPTAFANHTNALYLGAIIGPVVAGAAGALLGWRAAFFVLFVPIIATTLVATRLRDPMRGATDVRAGEEDHAAATHESPPKFWPSCRKLWRIRTLRRLFLASILIGAGLLPLAATMPLFLEREFGLGSAARGAVGAAFAAATFFGVRRSGRLTPSWFAKGMHIPLRQVGLAFGAVGPGLVVTALSPWLPLTIAVGLVSNFFAGYLFAPLAAVQALVSPARERSLSFSLGAIFLVIGVFAFFAVGLGSISDTYGIRWGIGILAPFFVLGGAAAASAGRFVRDDAAAMFA